MVAPNFSFHPLEGTDTAFQQCTEQKTRNRDDAAKGKLDIVILSVLTYFFHGGGLDVDDGGFGRKEIPQHPRLIVSLIFARRAAPCVAGGWLRDFAVLATDVARHHKRDPLATSANGDRVF